MSDIILHTPFIGGEYRTKRKICKIRSPKGIRFKRIINKSPAITYMPIHFGWGRGFAKQNNLILLCIGYDYISVKKKVGAQYFIKTFKIKNGKLFYYHYTKFINRPATGIRNKIYSFAEDDFVGEICYNLSSDKMIGDLGKYHSLVKAEVVNLIRKEFAKLAARFDVEWDASVPIEKNIIKCNYPVCHELSIDRPTLHLKYRKLLKGDFNKMTRNIFGAAGKKGKKMVLDQLRNSVNHLALNKLIYSAKEFIKLYSLDETYYLLENCKMLYSLDDKVELSIGYKYLGANKFKNLLINQNDGMWWVRDSLNMLQKLKENDDNYKVPNCKTFHELHEELNRDLKYIKNPIIKLPIPDKYKEFFDSNPEIDNYKIVWPESNYTMIDWGNKLNICVGSYADWVKQGNTAVFGLEKDGEIKYCVEVQKKEIRQFRGKCNQDAPKELREALGKYLLDNKIVNGYKYIHTDEIEYA